MRASLVSAVLSSLLLLAGNPGLADNDPAAVKGGASASAEGPTSVTPPSTSAPTALPPASAEGDPKSVATPIPTQSPTPSAAPTAITETAVAPTETPALEPHKRPVPEGYAAAAELFKLHKFPQAQKEFEKIVASGTADVNTHLCLAHCFLQQKIYSKAIKEFDWLGKYAKNSMTLQKSCEHTARSLRNAMKGVCPANCIKGNDPRWTLKAGHKVIQYPHNGGGVDTFTPEQIGQLMVFEHGNAIVKGTCPVCEGTTEIPVLKDGGPMPRI